MHRSQWLLLTAIVFVAGIAAGPAAGPAEEPADEDKADAGADDRAIPALGENHQPLRQDLTAGNGKVRIVVLASPTRRSGQTLAGLLVRHVATAPENQDLSLHVVWCKSTQRDSAERADKWHEKWSRIGVHHYWSGDDRFGAVIRTAIPELEKCTPLEGVVLILGPADEWKDDAPFPAPRYWMHQRKEIGKRDLRWFRSDIFLEQVEAALIKDPDDVAAIPTHTINARGDPKKRCFLHGPKTHKPPPKAGYGLLVVLPGGGGDAGFRPFVKRMLKHALGDDWLVLQLVSVHWEENPSVVWPTKTRSMPGMKFGTEEFVEAALKHTMDGSGIDGNGRLAIDPTRVYVMGWSSGGPATYAISLGKTRARGFYAAQSVFVPERLPPLEGARGKAYVIDHSPEDEKCPYPQAQEAERQLREAGAATTLVTYKGGHGWKDNPWLRIRNGIHWLDEHRDRKR